jgi:hypothetical protein
MTFFFLPKYHPITVEDLQDGIFYIPDQLLGLVCPVPNDHAPVWCEYIGFTTGHDSWKNPISGKIYETHPLGLTERDSSFFEGFYELTQIEGLNFREGEAWCFKTNSQVMVEKPDPMSVWNPFLQQYDQPCDRNERDCDSERIAYNFLTNKIHELFTHNMDQFFEVYCQCCRCKSCRNVHEWDCADASYRTMEW